MVKSKIVSLLICGVLLMNGATSSDVYLQKAKVKNTYKIDKNNPSIKGNTRLRQAGAMQGKDNNVIQNINIIASILVVEPLLSKLLKLVLFRARTIFSKKTSILTRKTKAQLLNQLLKLVL